MVCGACAFAGCTGASFGQWKLPWSSAERQDSLAVLDWMQTQQWCNGKVVLIGQSYDATAALFTASMGHPMVKGVVALYPFWDMYNDIAIPGGIAMKSFSETWARFCQAMDYNNYSILPMPVRLLLSIVSRGCNPVVSYAGARYTTHTCGEMVFFANKMLNRIIHPSRSPTPNLAVAGAGAATGATSAGAARSGNQPCILDSGHSYRSWARQAADDAAMNGPVIDGSTIPTKGSSAEGMSARGLHIAVRRHYKETGNRMLRKAVAQHDTWDSAAAMRSIRFTDQEAAGKQATTADVSLCSKADQLREANVPLQVFSGWLDATAAAAISLYSYCGKASGSELVLGPWSHGGLTDQDTKEATSFSQSRHSVAFINKCCSDTPPAPPDTPPAAKHQQPSARCQTPLSSTPQTNGVAQYQDQQLVSKPEQGMSQLGNGQHAVPKQGQHFQHSGKSERMANVHRYSGMAKQSAAAQPLQLSGKSERVVDMYRDAGRGDQNGAAQQNRVFEPDDSGVHYFMMGKGSKRGWRHTPRWPPPEMQSLKLYLTAGSRTALSPSPSLAPLQGQSETSPGPASVQGRSGTSPVLDPALGRQNVVNRLSRLSDYSAFQESQRGLGVGAPVQQQQLPQQQQQNGQILYGRAAKASAEQGNDRQVSPEVVQPVQSKKKQGLQVGVLSNTRQDCLIRFRHEVHLQKPLKGLSRYDAIADFTKKMHYDNLGRCGHLTFTGDSLQQDTQVLGAIGVEIWVESSSRDADLFVYLEDIDPSSKKVGYVTEGAFRASHRKEYETPPKGDPRARASLPGEPFHSFSRRDVEEMSPGEAVLCRFQMMPTAYCFAKGHSVRVAVSGKDTKHFYNDHLDNQTIWIHCGPGRESAISLKTVPW